MPLTCWVFYKETTPRQRGKNPKLFAVEPKITFFFFGKMCLSAGCTVEVRGQRENREQEVIRPDIPVRPALRKTRREEEKVFFTFIIVYFYLLHCIYID